MLQYKIDMVKINPDALRKSFSLAEAGWNIDARNIKACMQALINDDLLIVNELKLNYRTAVDVACTLGNTDNTEMQNAAGMIFERLRQNVAHEELDTMIDREAERIYSFITRLKDKHRFEIFLHVAAPSWFSCKYNEVKKMGFAFFETCTNDQKAEILCKDDIFTDFLRAGHTAEIDALLPELSHEQKAKIADSINPETFKKNSANYKTALRYKKALSLHSVVEETPQISMNFDDLVN